MEIVNARGEVVDTIDTDPRTAAVLSKYLISAKSRLRIKRDFMWVEFGGLSIKAPTHIHSSEISRLLSYDTFDIDIICILFIINRDIVQIDIPYVCDEHISYPHVKLREARIYAKGCHRTSKKKAIRVQQIMKDVFRI